MKRWWILLAALFAALLLGWVLRSVTSKEEVATWGVKDWIAVVSLCLAVGSLCFNWFQWRWGEKEKRDKLCEIDTTFSNLYGMHQTTDRILRRADVPAEAREDIAYVNGEINSLRRRLSTLAQNEHGRLPRAVNPADHMSSAPPPC